MNFDKARIYYVYICYLKDTQEVFYVGKGRGNRHRDRAGRNEFFQKAIEEHEYESVIVSWGLTEEEAFEREAFVIKCLREMGHPLTNIQDGGYAPPIIYGKRSDEWRASISAGLRKFHDEHPEENKKISDRMKAFLKTGAGKEFSRRSLIARRTEEFREKQKERSRKANGTAEYRKRQSEDKIRYYKEHGTEALSGKNNHNAQTVEQYTIDGELIATYETATEASRATGVSVSKISAVAKGRRKTAGGFLWKYPHDKHITLKRENKYDVTKDKCAKAIVQYAKDGTRLREFPSISSAERFLGKERGRVNISKNLKGEIKSAYGFVWKYK